MIIVFWVTKSITSGIRALTSMGPPTVVQRIDQLEEKATGIEEAMADMVSKAVDTAMSAMKQSLTELLLEGQQVAAKKQSADLDALANRLKGRLN